MMMTYWVKHKHLILSSLVHMVLIIVGVTITHRIVKLPPETSTVQVSLSSEIKTKTPQVSKPKQKLAQQKKPRQIKQVKKEPKKLLSKTSKLPSDYWYKMRQASIKQEWQSMHAARQLDAINHVRQHIQAFWYVPAVMSEPRSTKLSIGTSTDGKVLSVRVKKSSGSAMLDSACVEAVWASSPLPLPEDQDINKDFRSFDLIMRPEAITGLS